MNCWGHTTLCTRGQSNCFICAIACRVVDIPKPLLQVHQWVRKSRPGQLCLPLKHTFLLVFLYFELRTLQAETNPNPTSLLNFVPRRKCRFLIPLPQRELREVYGWIHHSFCCGWSLTPLGSTNLWRSGHPDRARVEESTSYLSSPESSSEGWYGSHHLLAPLLEEVRLTHPHFNLV